MKDTEDTEEATLQPEGRATNQAQARTITPEVAERLRAGVRRALRFPEGFDMSWWARESSSVPCGTVCCYAGELLLELKALTPEQLKLLAIKALDPFYEASEIPHLAEAAVGVPEEFLSKLFYATSWPRRYWRAYHSHMSAGNYRGAVLVLQDVVEEFIRTDGRWDDWEE